MESIYSCIQVVEVERWGCTCDYCAHEWVSRTEALPKRCAKCRSPRWNDSETRTPEEVRAAGRAKTRREMEKKLRTATPAHAELLRRGLAEINKHKS